jgi:hypothetical protein
LERVSSLVSATHRPRYRSWLDKELLVSIIRHYCRTGLEIGSILPHGLCKRTFALETALPNFVGKRPHLTGKKTEAGWKMYRTALECATRTWSEAAPNLAGKIAEPGWKIEPLIYLNPYEISTSIVLRLLHSTAFL